MIVFDQEYPEKVVLLIAKEIISEFFKVYTETQVASVTSKCEKIATVGNSSSIKNAKFVGLLGGQKYPFWYQNPKIRKPKGI